MPPRLATVLGKRTRSNSNSTVASTCSLDTVTTSKSVESPTKRLRTRSILGIDQSEANKENIPPLKTDEAATTTPAVTVTTAPSSSRSTPRRSTSGPRTPSKFTRTESTPVIELGNLQLVTPPVTPSKNSTAQPLALYASGRALLRTSSSSTSAASFTGREQERKVITDFFSTEEKLCLYISGTPGTGKTALVNDVLRAAKADVQSRYLNCMGMGVDEIQKLTRQTRDEEAEEEKTMVMVLDELEHLDSDSLTLVLAVATPAFRIIGISNTHTLTTKPSVSTLTLHFKPYTAQQMTDIISKRLNTLSLPEDVKFLIAPPALSFACKKIASQTGDLRSCLSLVRGAIEVAEKEHTKKTSANEGKEPVPFLPASIAHVISATKSITTQAPGTVGVVRQLNLQARLVLLSVLLAVRRVAASLSLIAPTTSSSIKSPVKGKPKAKPAETLSADVVFAFYSRLLSGSDAAFHAVSRSEFTDLLGMLETQGLLERGGAGATPVKGKGKKADKGEVVKLPSNSREEEMIKGLTECEAGQMEGPVEREIRSIWNRESSKIKREVEDREMTMKKRKDAFEDAEEA